MFKPQVQCALGMIQELLINVRVEKRSQVVLLSLVVQCWALHIRNHRSFYRELTYSLITMRAVVDVFESQFKHLQLLWHVFLYALGSQPPLPKEQSLFLLFTCFPCAWSLRGKFQCNLRKIITFVLKYSVLENSLCNNSTWALRKSASI